MPLAAPCPACGAANEPGDRYCGNCGTALATPAAGVSSAASRVAAPSAAERRTVTVLFADLVGFTPVSDGEDPEAIRDMLSRYFAVARERIDRYGGTVEKFIGDAVMAVWGTPTAHEDDAERAVRAAFELVDAVATLEGPDGSPLRLRAAVATGEAAVDLAAVGEAMVTGDIVNTASRLQSVAAPGSVVVGEGTVRAASGAIAFESLGPQQLKGKAEPVPAWRAVRVVANRGGAGRTERLEAPFVGRDDEFRHLKDLFHATERERRARIVSVVGQAGIGKSRLAWEFEKYIDGLVGDVYWHQGRSPAYGEGVTFWALGEMVRRRAGIAEGEDAEATRAKLTATLDRWLPDPDERRWVEPRLAHLLGLREAPAGQVEELHAAWRRFFERIAEHGPTVLVFEDLQWADRGLVSFIESVVEWSRQYPILVITLSRPELVERHPTWGAGQRNFSSLNLEPLGQDEMAELLAGLVPGLPEDASRAILDRAEGIPLYAIETVRMLVDAGALVPEEDGCRVARPIERLDVPESLQAVIAARLDGLSPEERALVQDASVLGQSFTIESLAAISARPVDELETALRPLARREILSVEVDPRSPERGHYRWVQGVIREVAYARLARRERVARHLAAARYLESLGDDELAGILAGHYAAAHRAADRGPEADALAAQARLALVGAANRARSLHSHDQALGYLEQALEVAADPVEQATLHEQAAAAAAAAARSPDAIRHLEQAIGIQQAAGDRVMVARLTAKLGANLLMASKVEPALEALTRAMAELPPLDEDPVGVPIAAALGRAYLLHGEADAARPWIDAALDAAEKHDLREQTEDLLISKGWVLALAGHYREAVALLEGALASSVRSGSLQSMSRARMMVSNYLATEDPIGAFRVGREGSDQFLALGMRGNAGALAGNAAYGALQAGDWEWVLEAREQIDRPELNPISRTGLTGVAAVIEAFRGHPDRAAALLASLDPGIAGSTSPQDHHVDIDAMVALASGDLEAAEARAFESMQAINQEPIAMQFGIRASAWRRDLDAIRRWETLIDQPGFRGAWADGCRQELATAIAALEGRQDEALERGRATTARWRELGVDFDVAMSILDRLILLGPGAASSAEVAEARAIFERVGAVTMLDRVGAALGADGSGELADSPAAAGPGAGDRTEAQTSRR